MLLLWVGERPLDSENCVRTRPNSSVVVEAGEEIDITVAGRLVARLVPAASKRWQRWAAIANLFAGAPDPDWDRDRDLIDQTLANP